MKIVPRLQMPSPIAVIVWALLGMFLYVPLGRCEDPQVALDAIRKKHKIVGLMSGSLGVQQETQVVSAGFAAAFGKEKLSASHAIHLGSCTKSMTATLIGMMVDEGKLSWETTLDELFENDREISSSSWAKVTVESLIHHTSGAPANAPWSEISKSQKSEIEQRRNVLSWLMKRERPANPVFLYSNIGYVVLGHIIEKLSGRPWESIIRERLFQPLEMHSAGFGPPRSVDGSRAMGHVSVVGIPMPVDLDNPPVLGPAGTVHATMDDWSKYLRLHLNDPSIRKQIRISDESLNYLHLAKQNENYAGGWVCERREWAGGNVLWHNGSNTFWYCVVYLAPEQNRGFFAMSNNGIASSKACDEAINWLIRNNPYIPIAN